MSGTSGFCGSFKFISNFFDLVQFRYNPTRQSEAINSKQIVNVVASPTHLFFALETGFLHYVHTASLSVQEFKNQKMLKQSPSYHTHQLFTRELKAMRIVSKRSKKKGKNTSATSTAYMSKEQIQQRELELANRKPDTENYLICIGSDDDTFLKGKIFHVRDDNAGVGSATFEKTMEWYIHGKDQQNVSVERYNLKVRLEVSDDHKHMAMYFETARQQSIEQTFYGAVIVTKFESGITSSKSNAAPYQQYKEFSSAAPITNIAFARAVPITEADPSTAPTSLFVTTNRFIYEAELKSSSGLNITSIESKPDESTKDGIGAQNAVASSLLKKYTPHSKDAKKDEDPLTKKKAEKKSNVFRPQLSSFSQCSLLVLSDTNLFLYAPKNSPGRGSLLEDGKVNMKLGSNIGSPENRIVKWYNNYLILVHKKPAGTNAAVVNDKKYQVCLKIFDMEHKYMVYDQVLKPASSSTIQLYTTSIVDVVPCTHASSIFVITKDETGEGLLISMLKEKSLDSKLSMLAKKYAYPYAIALAKQGQSLDIESYKATTRTKYGDYLFSKGKYQDAIRQYILTISHLEPSYVIRKFLDSKKNSYLIQYLYALHIKGGANHDHTTLMLNCFMRLDEDEVDKNDKEEGHEDDDTYIDEDEENVDEALQSNLKIVMDYVEAKDKDKVFQLFIDKINLLKYDAETAIHVFRVKGYRTQSLELAETIAAKSNDYALHSWVVKINIEDFPDGKKKGPDGIVRVNQSYEDALQHIESLELPLAERFMREYGKVLVSKLDRQATNVLIRLCTHYKPIPQHVSVKDRNWHVTHETVEKDRAQALAIIDQKSGGDRKKKKKAREIKFHVDEPRDYIFTFANKNEWLLVFLEVVTKFHEREYPDHRLDKVMYNTLLELYLIQLSKESLLSDQEKDRKKVIEQYTPAEEIASVNHGYAISPVYENNLTDNYDKRAMDLLTMDELSSGRDERYDQEHALVLVQSKMFESGILYLYEKLGLKYDIIQYYMDKDDADIDRKFFNIFNECKKHGDDDPNLWKQVLSYFANGGSRNLDADKAKIYQQKSKHYVDKVLAEIEQRGVLAPLIVVQILARDYKDNNYIELSTVKKYLSQKLQKEQETIMKQKREITDLQRETDKLTSDVNELRTSAKIFQLTLCSLCNTELDLPAVHFMCMHSYHQRCLEVEECPKCAKDHKEAVEHMERVVNRQLSVGSGIQSQSGGETHDEFFKMLKDSSDGFKRVADMFGTSIFANRKTVSDDDMIDGGDDDMML